MKGFAFPRRFKSADSLLATLSRNNRELLAFLNNFVIRFDSDGSTVTLPGDLSVAGGLTVIGDITTEGWTAPSLLNSWVNFGSGHRDAGYKKTADGTVHVKGMVKDGSPVTGVIFTLPVGYRPSEKILFSQYGALGLIRLDVEANGNLSFVAGGSASFSSLDCSFQV